MRGSFEVELQEFIESLRPSTLTIDGLTAIITAAINDERERCAQIAFGWDMDKAVTRKMIAARIRSGK